MKLNDSKVFALLTSDFIHCIIRTVVLIWTNDNQFDLMIDAITELAEEKRAIQPALHLVLPTLKHFIADSNPLPQEALYLGLAEDGLPVLLNLFDPHCWSSSYHWRSGKRQNNAA